MGWLVCLLVCLRVHLAGCLLTCSRAGVCVCLRTALCCLAHVVDILFAGWLASLLACLIEFPCPRFFCVLAAYVSCCSYTDNFGVCACVCVKCLNVCFSVSLFPFHVNVRSKMYVRVLLKLLTK